MKRALPVGVSLVVLLGVLFIFAKPAFASSGGGCGAWQGTSTPTTLSLKGCISASGNQEIADGYFNLSTSDPSAWTACTYLIRISDDSQGGFYVKSSGNQLCGNLVTTSGTHHLPAINVTGITNHHYHAEVSVTFTFIGRNGSGIALSNEQLFFP